MGAPARARRDPRRAQQGVAGAWLLADEALLERRARADEDFHRDAADVDAMIAVFVGRSAYYNAHVRAAAGGGGTLCVEVAGDEPVEVLVDRVLSVLAAPQTAAAGAG